MYAAAAAAKSLQLCPTLQPHRRQPTRLCRPWDSPGKNTEVGCYFLLRLMYAGLHKILSTGNVVHSGSGQGNWPISPGLSNQHLTPHQFPSLRAHHPNFGSSQSRVREQEQPYIVTMVVATVGAGSVHGARRRTSLVGGQTASDRARPQDW